MTFLGLVYVVLAWTWVQLLPGWLVSRWLVPDALGAERAGIALLCAWSVVPLGLFLLSVAAAVPMDASSLGLFSTGMNLIGMFDRRHRAALRADWYRGAIFLGLALAIGACLALGYRSLDGGDVFSTVHHCLYVIVMHAIANDPSAAIPLYDAASDGVIHYLVHHQTGQFNGLAPLFFEQRLGNAPILAPSVALFGTAGWWWASATTGAAMWVYTYLIARTLSASRFAAVLGASVFTLGIHNLCMYFVNENTYAVTLTAVLLWGAVSCRRSAGWLILLGVAAGHLVGVRYTSALILPAVVLAALWRDEPWPTRSKRFALAALAFSLTILPWLYVNDIMLDAWLTHPKIHAEHEGRVVTNTLLGTEFEFRALNWPFIDDWSRTAWNPFPTLVWLPLQLGQNFGHLAMATVLLGLFALRSRRREFWIMCVFALPHTFAIGWLETLDWEQLTYTAPGLVPLAAWMAVGIDHVRGAPIRRGAYLAIAVAAVIGLNAVAKSGQWPIDRRMLARVDAPERVTVRDEEGPGVALVRDWLTQPRLFPQLPVYRTSYGANLWGALSHLPAATEKPLRLDRCIPVVEWPYWRDTHSLKTSLMNLWWRGAPVLSNAAPMRTSLGLHQVSLKLPAERLRVSVVRRQGQYAIDVVPLGGAVAERDFTFWLHPWMPPIETIELALNGSPITGLRTLEYGGSMEMDQLRFVLTNYPAEVHDIIELPYTVQTDETDQGPVAKCGLFLFLGEGSDPTKLETLVLAGGHDTFWMGTPTGVLKIPRNIEATSLVLYTDPTCSTHVPQPGDQYAIVNGPFSDKPIQFNLTKHWLPD